MAKTPKQSRPDRRRLGAIDSIKGEGEIIATLSLEARGQPLLGAFVRSTIGDEIWLMRIANIVMHNPVHENDQFAPIIMDRGSIPEWSAVTDIERANPVKVISILNAKGEYLPRLRCPPSGTPIEEVIPEDFNQFMREKKFYAVIGQIANSNGAPATIVNRSFDIVDLDGDDIGGHGEARHIAIFGKNGSGKGVLVLMLLVVKIAMFPEMGLLLPDTQGDYADPNKHNRGSFRWNYQEALETCGIRVEVIKIEDVALRSKEILKPLLKQCLLRLYNTGASQAEKLSGLIVESLFEKEVDPKLLTAEVIADEVIKYIGNVYAKASRAEHVEDAQNFRADPTRMRPLRNDLKYEVAVHFEGRYDIREIVDGVLTRGRKIILDMGSQPESQKSIVMQELLQMIKYRSQRQYRRADSKLANAIVILDEAPRWAPQVDDDSGLKGIVLSAMRESRKVGVGWWLIGQSPADIDKTVMRQAHTTYFGRGLGVGIDKTHLENELDKDGWITYQELQRQPDRFFWVGIGLDANIGHDRTFFAFAPFGGDATNALMRANPHIWTSKPKL